MLQAELIFFPLLQLIGRFRTLNGQIRQFGVIVQNAGRFQHFSVPETASAVFAVGQQIQEHLLIQPELVYGFSTQFTWRNLDLSAAFAGSYGNEVYNALGRRLELTGDSYNVLTTVKDSWTPQNGGNTLPLASNARPFSYIDSRYVQSASYLKLRNLTVGYRLPQLKSVPVGIRVYTTAANLFTITSYKGYDPEVASGTDSGAYPSSRSFIFGINLTL